MLESLSSGYYLSRVTVEPHDREHAVLAAHQHREAAAAVYATGEGIERLDQPLVVKLGRQHVPVFGDTAIPTGTLAAPAAVVEAAPVSDPPTVTEILVAKADRAALLLEWFSPYEWSTPSYC